MSDKLNAKDIAAIRERCERATEGPCVALSSVAEGGDPSDTWFIKAQPHPALRGFTKDVAMVEGRENAEFVAHSFADIPALLADRDRLVEALQYVLEDDGLVPRATSKCREVVRQALDDIRP